MEGFYPVLTTANQVYSSYPQQESNHTDSTKVATAPEIQVVATVFY